MTEYRVTLTTVTGKVSKVDVPHLERALQLARLAWDWRKQPYHPPKAVIVTDVRTGTRVASFS